MFFVGSRGVSFATAAALLALVASSTLTLAGAQTGPPPTPKREVVDTYFGTAITDPYRWMETPVDRNPEFRRWLEAQNAYTRRVLDSLSGRAALQTRLAALAEEVATVTEVDLAGPRWFYLKTKPGQQIAKLYTRDTRSGRDRVLVDPDTLPGKGSSHWAIDYVVPSPDGRVVAYGASLGGSEKTTLYLMDASTGRLLPDSVSRVQFGIVTWSPDGRSFYYNRLDAAGDTNPNLRYRNSGAFRHVIGQPVARDELMLQAESTPSVPLGPDDFPSVVPVEASPYVFAVVARGVQREITLYVARQRELRGAATPWRKLVDVGDGVVAAQFHRSDVYLLTHKDAPRFKIVRVKADAADLADAEVVVPESASVLTAMAVANDGLYVQELEHGLGRLRRVPFTAKTRGGVRVALPVDGAISQLVTDRRKAGIVFPLESWTQSRRWYTYNPAEGRVRDTKLLGPVAVDMSPYVSVEVEVPSHDGAKVPLSIVHRMGLIRDRSHPVLLMGYGAYGITMDPSFNPMLLAWLERGGIYAVAHVRGGGEYGEEWHLAGKGAAKPNTWKDFIACAQYLVEEQYTSTERLTAIGGSAGGILIGRAITDRPDLFRAVVARVGLMNVLRAEHEPSGPANVPEFGTVTTEAGFRALREMDAVDHVRPEVRYPAVLLTAGIHDSRVEPWQPAKMAAALQERSTSGYPVLLRVGFDAGHGMGLTKAQRVVEMADIYGFLLWQLSDTTESRQP